MLKNSLGTITSGRMTDEEKRKIKFQQDLNAAEAQKKQADSLMQQYIDRGSFSWNPETDKGFQQYASLMKDQGNLAMRDTMAKAASMTGGYGNSYATSAAGQTYNQYLANIDQKANDYYAMALDAFNQEGNDLLNKASLANAAWESEYNRLYEDAATRAQYGDYQDYIGMLGVSDEDYRTTMQNSLPAPTTEQVQGYLEAVKQGTDKAKEYAAALDSIGVDTRQLDNYYQLAILSGSAGAGYSYDKGVPTYSETTAKEAQKANRPITDTGRYMAVKGVARLNDGQNFHVKTPVGSRDVEVGSEVTDENIKALAKDPSVTSDLGRGYGYSLFAYNGAMYITDGNAVYMVKARKNNKKEYDTVMSYLQ